MTTTTTMEESETRDSCYFPGCRKDANCNCEICLASINATLDLMPLSVQKSSLTKLSRSEPSVDSTPISFDPMFMSTPTSVSSSISKPPPKKSTAKMEKLEKQETKMSKREDFSKIYVVLKVGLILGSVLGLEFAFCWVVNGVLRPRLTKEVVKNVGERSYVAADLNRRLKFLQKELKGVVGGGKISSCSHSDSKWDINQDGLLLKSRCVLHKSASEEVSVWGWPLQTAGLLQTGFSSSSFTIISGRLTEWSNGKLGFLIRNANTTWTQSKWTGSVVQLDPNTWVLEYSRSSILDNPSFILMTLEILKHRMSQAARKMNQELFCLLSASGNERTKFDAKAYNKIPT